MWRACLVGNPGGLAGIDEVAQGMVHPSARRGRYGEVGRIVGHRKADVLDGQRRLAWVTAVVEAVVADSGIGHTTQRVRADGGTAVVVGRVADGVEHR